MMRHHLHMPSYFLGTFTEYPIKRTSITLKPNLSKIYTGSKTFTVCSLIALDSQPG